MLTVRFKGYAVRWLKFLGRLQLPAAVQSRYADHVAEFADYLIQERGLSPRTVAYDRRATHEFLIAAENGIPVAEVDQIFTGFQRVWARMRELAGMGFFQRLGVVFGGGGIVLVPWLLVLCLLVARVAGW